MTTNEKNSSGLAKSFLTDNNVASSFVRTVERLILATAAHLQETTAVDAEWFLDADLAILAAEPDAYNEYVLAIRQEYSEFSDEASRAGRIRFLETILNDPYLLKTDVRRDRSEASARKNLPNEVVQLQSDHA